MDALKFAFEILIVGALALPWMAVLIRVFSPDSAPGEHQDSLSFFLLVVPESARNAVGSVVIIALGYVLGSAVSRISRNLFDDQILVGLPTEQIIRVHVYQSEYCDSDLLNYRRWPNPVNIKNSEWLIPALKDLCPNEFNEVYRHLPLEGKKALVEQPQITAGPTSASAEEPYQLVRETFGLQEGKLLLNGLDKVDRLKEYYDQITVLRGAALNWLILSWLSLFGMAGYFGARLGGHPLARASTFLPALSLVLFSIYATVQHFRIKHVTSLYFDPPLAEGVLFLIGTVGFFVTSRAKREKFYFPTFAVAVILMVVSFGGWWWTEIMYDRHVIHSVPELRGHVEAISRTPAPGSKSTTGQPDAGGAAMEPNAAQTPPPR